MQTFDHEVEVIGTALSPNGETLCTVSRDKDTQARRIHIWNRVAEKHEFDIRTRARTTPTGAVRFCVDSSKLLVGTDRRSILFDLFHRKEIVHLDLENHSGQLPQERNKVLAVSPDAERLLTGYDVASLRVWRVNGDGEHVLRCDRRGEAAVRSAGPRFWFKDAVFSGTGDKVLTLSNDGALRMWSVQTGEQLARYPAENMPLSCDISGDGKFVCTCGLSTPVKVRDLTTGQVVQLPNEKGRSFTTAMFMPDGRRILTLDTHEMMRIWDTQQSNVLYEQKLKGISDYVSAVFPGDGSMIIAGAQPESSQASVAVLHGLPGMTPISAAARKTFPGLLERIWKR